MQPCLQRVRGEGGRRGRAGAPWVSQREDFPRYSGLKCQSNLGLTYAPTHKSTQLESASRSPQKHFGCPALLLREVESGKSESRRRMLSSPVTRRRAVSRVLLAWVPRGSHPREPHGPHGLLQPDPMSPAMVFGMCFDACCYVFCPNA